VRTPLRSSPFRAVDRRCLSWPLPMTTLKVAVSTHDFALLHLSKQGGKLDADCLTYSEVLVPINVVKRETDRVSLATVYTRMRGLIPAHGMTRDFSPIIDIALAHSWHDAILPHTPRFVKVRARDPAINCIYNFSSLILEALVSDKGRVEKVLR